ncbi:MAG: SUMF1/EgtB/PvdO family nonheme iron enzyme [Thermoflexales bacterium]|nr:SUMF1/EgtB/PvdO family nonheme iron enzyme [Thermoflexales bacterium]
MEPSSAEIRQFLRDLVSDDELTELCFDYFRDVQADWAAGMQKGQKIQALLDYCERHGKTPHLLTAMSKSWPERYRQRFASVLPAAPSAPPTPLQRDPRQVFISHAHQDADMAHRLAADLQAGGWPVWIAPDSIQSGERWVSAINRGLKASGVFALVLTPAAVNSDWVQDETSAALEMTKREGMRFISLDVEPCDVPPLWGVRQHISFQGSYERGLSRLLAWLEQRSPAASPVPSTKVPSSPDKQALDLGTSIAPTPISRPSTRVSPQLASRRTKSPWWKMIVGGLQQLRVPAWGVAALALPALVALWLVGQSVFPSHGSASTATATATMPVANLNPTTAIPPPTATPMPKLGEQTTRPVDGMVMVYVPAGEFMMGSTDEEVNQAWELCKQYYASCSKDWITREQPRHKVSLNAFWIDRTEVTNAQYKKCVNAGACEASSYANESSYNGEDQPVVGVSWSDANEYCKWAGGELPTEAQWEYAARGTDGRTFPWGNEQATCDYAVMNDGSGSGCGKGVAWPVGSKPKGASWVGAQDMAGNIWEWVADWYGAYPSEAQTDPTGPATGSSRVLRGGNWSGDPAYVRAAVRYGLAPGDRRGYVGFRCVVVGAPGQ